MRNGTFLELIAIEFLCGILGMRKKVRSSSLALEYPKDGSEDEPKILEDMTELQNPASTR